MANITKEKRDKMLTFLEELKTQHSDDTSVRALNEIENHLKDKKFGIVFEEHTEEVDELLKENIPVLCADELRRICKDEKLPWNFIIEGDNLQALYLLEKTHYGKIDCIYIDPPYNTGAKDWKYNNDYVDKNDVFRHSKWLSMMNERLRLARKLLKSDGALITTIDDNELATVYLLISEIFPECLNTIITIQMNPGGTQGKNFSVTNEYAIITYFPQTQIFRKKHDGGDTYNLRRWGSTSNRYEGATCFYPIILDNNNEIIGFGDVLDDNIHPASQVEINDDGTKYVWPFDIQGIEKKWRYARDTVESVKSRMFVEQKGDRIEVMLRRETEPPKTVWVNNEYNAESFGTKFIKEIIGKDKFSYPKSIYATKDCLSMIVAEKPNAVVLDFFAGSGTTLNALNLINAEDGGSRKCILVTNNEVSEKEEKQLLKKGLTPQDKEWDELGIAKSVTWTRSKCTIEGKKEDGTLLTGEYITSLTEVIEKRRTFTQIDYIDIGSLKIGQKRQFVSLFAKGVIPQSIIKSDTKYIASNNEKHTVGILFDDSAVNEWVTELEENKHIVDFYLVTKSTKLFNETKERINSILGNITEERRVVKPMSDGFQCNLKYFKCDWTPRKPQDYLLSNALCLHIKEMIELENAIEVDNIKNVLILNKDEFKNTILKPENYEKVENIWVNQNIILNADEMRLLREKGFKYIPREFFGQELREAAE